MMSRGVVINVYIMIWVVGESPKMQRDPRTKTNSKTIARGQGGQERGVVYDRHKCLRIDIPKMKSSRHNGAKRAYKPLDGQRTRWRWKHAY